MNSIEFDRYLSENCSKPEYVIVHPDLYKVSDDESRLIFYTPIGIYCYRDGVCMGEAMNEEDAILWITENKEIVMWT